MTDTGDRSKSSDTLWPAPPPALSPTSSSRRRSKTAGDLFLSSKTATPIPLRHPALHDALIQASLDPQVRSIVYIPSANATVLQRDDGSFLLDVVPTRRIRTSEEQRRAQIALTDLGLKPIALTAEEIRREPRYSNVRLVWSYRESPVSVGLRLRILLTLLDEGPMPLGELLKSIRSEVDPAPAVMALACADLLVLDLASEPLGPRTIARSRS
ncbi:hypothetical protein [Bradyrhizobium sp. AS23.2]|uniref:hypothetical protein n=1 Tax=Bradyrhizobium sp. AS23.2 TaxID=1680155 RepID=UPI00093A28EF|nr:hypothetical protein [Bradyrhizobium sp. AS23.2]OKO83228.1 hypothetical protein AC630_11760 [Bradyrhizobium sp. AS23.2]